MQVERVEGEAMLPQVYDPETISAYWGKRPGSVLTRIAQLLSVAGGFLSHIAWDIITKKVKEVDFTFFRIFFLSLSPSLIYPLYILLPRGDI